MKTTKLNRFTRKKLLLIAGLAVVTAVVMGAGGFAFAATQEQNDSFCASCHTQPESTYYERSIASETVG